MTAPPASANVVAPQRTYFRVADVPVDLDQVRGEHWASYLARMSRATGTDLGTIHAALYDEEAGPVTSRQLAKPAPGLVRRARQRFGLTPDEVQAMHLVSYDTQCFSLQKLNLDAQLDYTALRQALWLRRTSASCTHCLRHDGAWRTSWHFGWRTVCPIHHTWLEHACRECGELLPDWIKGTTSRRALQHQARPHRCVNSQDPAPPSSRSAGEGAADPGQNTDDAPADTGEALALQRKLENIATCGAGTMFGRAASSWQIFEAYRAATRVALALRRTNRPHAERGGHSVRVVHDALVQADEMLTINDLDGAATLVEHWLDRARIRPTRRQLRLILGNDDGLEPVVEYVVNRNDSFERRRRQQPLWQSRYTAMQVPQISWPCALPREFAKRRTPPSDPLLRAVLSVMINRVRTDDWRNAALELGWTANDAANWRRRITNMLSRDHLRQLNQTALHLATRLNREAARADVYRNVPLPAARTDARLKLATIGLCRRSHPAAAWCPCIPCDTHRTSVGRS